MELRTSAIGMEMIADGERLTEAKRLYLEAGYSIRYAAPFAFAFQFQPRN